MFRECFFEYAGKSSQPYNLMLVYVNNTTSEFSSGGGFDLKTDTLPHSHEALIYGKDYSSQPLTFEVEIINLDDYIPLDQMAEIKNWLFGQDGWKTFKVLDERQDYCLKCVFEPIEDIVDGTGYRGLRCTLHNSSPFWYGEERSVVIDHSALTANTVYAKPYWFTNMYLTRQFGVFDIYIPENDNMVDIDIFPYITVTDWRGKYYADGTETYYPANSSETGDTAPKPTEFSFCLSNTNIDNIDDGIALDGIGFEYSDTCRIAFSTAYIGTNISSFTASTWDMFDISTRYGYINSSRFPTTQTQYRTLRLPYFRLHKGHNICRILEPTLYKDITFKYMPVYRLGAF